MKGEQDRDLTLEQFKGRLFFVQTFLWQSQSQNHQVERGWTNHAAEENLLDSWFDKK